MSADDWIKCDRLKEKGPPPKLHKSRKEQSRLPLRLLLFLLLAAHYKYINCKITHRGGAGDAKNVALLPRSTETVKKRNAISQVSMKAPNCCWLCVTSSRPDKNVPTHTQTDDQKRVDICSSQKDEVLAAPSQNGNTLPQEKTHTRWWMPENMKGDTPATLKYSAKK